MDFVNRSYQKELLDRDDIPFDAIERNMQELDTINTWLGGHAITVSGLRALLANTTGENSRNGEPLTGPGQQVHICEIGCGGGDNLIALRRYCRKQGIAATFTGIDINPHCIAVAKQKMPDGDAVFITSDYRVADFGGSIPDIVFSSLFCHHFTDEELVGMLGWMYAQARVGFFINDLHRHPLAYHSIRLLTGLFSRSWLVRNDAPLSVLRGFRREEWERLFEQAAIRDVRLSWKWAFRWLIVANKRLPVAGRAEAQMDSPKHKS